MESKSNMRWPICRRCRENVVADTSIQYTPVPRLSGVTLIGSLKKILKKLTRNDVVSITVDFFPFPKFYVLSYVGSFNGLRTVRSTGQTDRQTDGRTDRRTGKTYNAAYYRTRFVRVITNVWNRFSCIGVQTVLQLGQCCLSNLLFLRLILLTNTKQRYIMICCSSAQNTLVAHVYACTYVVPSFQQFSVFLLFCLSFYNYICVYCLMCISVCLSVCLSVCAFFYSLYVVWNKRLTD